VEYLHQDSLGFGWGFSDENHRQILVIKEEEGRLYSSILIDFTIAILILFEHSCMIDCEQFFLISSTSKFYYFMKS